MRSPTTDYWYCGKKTCDSFSSYWNVIFTTSCTHYNCCVIYEEQKMCSSRAHLTLLFFCCYFCGRLGVNAIVTMFRMLQSFSTWNEKKMQKNSCRSHSIIIIPNRCCSFECSFQMSYKPIRSNELYSNSPEKYGGAYLSHVSIVNERTNKKTHLRFFIN